MLRQQRTDGANQKTEGLTLRLLMLPPSCTGAFVSLAASASAGGAGPRVPAAAPPDGANLVSLGPGSGEFFLCRDARRQRFVLMCGVNRATH